LQNDVDFMVRQRVIILVTPSGVGAAGFRRLAVGIHLQEERGAGAVDEVTGRAQLAVRPRQMMDGGIAGKHGNGNNGGNSNCEQK
jgi:hypothetical protein